jgi:ribosome biogenesis GTP-binding protein YsxC/EngB
MKIKTAIFSGSSTRVEQKPARRLPEFAFIGRSNVGKSSLINALTGNSKLAKTSQTPGKTQLVNHFLINDSWYLVDLPGYGYARLPDKDRARLRHIIWDYINRSEELVMLFVLLDSRHDMQEVDLRFISELGEKGIPFGSSSPRRTSRARPSPRRRWKRTRRVFSRSGRNCRRSS